MSALSTKIVDLMRSDNPPGTVAALAAATGSSMNYCYTTITHLIQTGALHPDECPWRRSALSTKSLFNHKPPNPARRKGVVTADLEAALESIIAESSNDRVAAIRQLAEIRQASGSHSSVPAPDSHSAAVAALSRILQAAGRDATNEASALAWPLPADPPNDPQAPEAHLAESPPSGSGLD